MRRPKTGIETKISNHTFRATGITAYLKNGGALEITAAMANHSSVRTTQLYDRRSCGPFWLQVGATRHCVRGAETEQRTEVPAPLVKRTADGRYYVRPPVIESMLVELETLPRDRVLTRCRNRSRGDPEYVPSECLLNLVRACRSDNSNAHFERLYALLAERVLRALPRADSPDGQTTSLTRAKIRERVFDRFTEYLASDRWGYEERLDFFELRFDGALANLRRDAQEQSWREENRTAPLEYDQETGEPSTEVERAAGSYNPFETDKIEDADYRSRLDEAIEALPPEQSRIIHMLRLEIPIDSKDPTVVTIAKALGKSEKTIRTYRNKAMAALRAALEGDGR